MNIVKFNNEKKGKMPMLARYPYKKKEVHKKRIPRIALTHPVKTLIING